MDAPVVDPTPNEAPGFHMLEDGPPTNRVIPLTGWFERNGFHPLMTAFMMFVVSFLLFQGLATVVAMIALIAEEGVPSPEELLLILETATGPLLLGNTIGQFLGMALPVLLWTALHTREKSAFLRLSGPDPALLGLSVLGLLALLPIIQWLGEINSFIPVPDFFVELEQAQMELIERILGSDIGLPSTVFALAITPAICEELLFRGYLQRQFERSFGIAGGIAATGILFGVYHFRLTQVIPLAVLGIFLGWLVWRTGSLWAPILVHFLNNAFAIAAASAAAANPEWGIEDIEHLHVPIPLVLSGFAVLAATVYLMNRRVAALAETPTEEVR